MSDAYARDQGGPARRMAKTMNFARNRLRRTRTGAEATAWCRSLTVLAVLACAAIYAASFLDAAAIHQARLADPRVKKIFSYVTHLGQSHWYLVPAGVMVLTISVLDWSRRDHAAKALLVRAFGYAGFFFASIALSGILINVAKYMIGRARPALMDMSGPFNFEPFTYGYHYASFPSGHSTTTGAVAGALMLLFPKLAVPALVVGAVLALSRIAVRAHYPSDVVAGFSIGLLFAIFLARWLANRNVVFHNRAQSLLPVPR